MATEFLKPRWSATHEPAEANNGEITEGRGEEKRFTSGARPEPRPIQVTQNLSTFWRERVIRRSNRNCSCANTRNTSGAESVRRLSSSNSGWHASLAFLNSCGSAPLRLPSLPVHLLALLSLPILRLSAIHDSGIIVPVLISQPIIRCARRGMTFSLDPASNDQINALKMFVPTFG